MYCKNCGRQLKEGTRFCDRCGQSVRKNNQNSQTAKRKEIEELKAERLNRKRRLQEKEAKQARNKKRRKSKGNVVIFLVVALLIAIVSVIIGYNMMSPSDNGLGTTHNSTNTPASATNKPAETAKVSTTEAPSNSASKNGYSTMTISGVTCVYPSTFNSNPTTGNQKLNVTDALGGATMTVSQEGKSGAPADLMRDYARQTGGEVSYSRAGDDWYAVTITTSDTVYHRKCVLKNGIAVYYDFSYSAMSSATQKYTEYIDYMDSNFK